MNARQPFCVSPKNWDSSTKRLIGGLIQVNTSVEETKLGTDREAAILLAHELIHTLGFDHVRAGFASIMHSKEYGGGNFRLSQGAFRSRCRCFTR